MMNARLDLNALAGSSRRSLIFGGTALVAAIIVVAVIANLYGNASESTARVEAEALQSQADGLADEIGAVLQPIYLKLQALAKDETVIGAASAGDTATLTAVAAATVGDFPGARRLRILPLGDYAVDADDTPPFTYASIDMLRKARHPDAKVAAELHLAGTPQEHIVVIERIFEAGVLKGFVHISLDPAVVRETLNRNPPSGVQIEVRQTIPNGPPVIVAKHGYTPVAGETTLVATIPGTRWILALRRSQTQPRAASGGFSILGFAGLALALVAIAIGVVRVTAWRARRTPGMTSAIVYQGAIKAIMDGVHPGLDQLLNAPRGGANIEPGVKALSQGLDGEDITRLEIPGAANPESDDIGEAEIAADALGGSDFLDLTAAPAGDAEASISASIFRSYDIRGIVGETLTEDAVHRIGQALGTEAGERGQQTVVVARDGRISSPALKEALVAGLREAGRDVLDIGLTPTPVLYFATHYLDTRSGVMVTGSHNPPAYNGLKIVLDGETLSGEAIQAIRRRVAAGDFSSGAGTLEAMEIIPDYIRRVSEEIPVTLGGALKVVVDCGNSVPGIVAPHVLRALGHDVVELFCEVDGTFPHHEPDPSQPHNLADLIEAVREEDADLGLAFDGDGDRLGVVDRDGNIIWPDRQLMLFARDILTRHPGAKIIYDVKCTRRLGEVITAHGGQPIMAKTGHSLIKSQMQATGALLAGELSGHIFFKERWYGFDDALYSAARLLEILVNAHQSPEDVFAGLPGGIVTPELRLPMPEEEYAQIMQKIIEAAEFPDGQVTTIDGLRVDFPDSWGLVRPSNTTPCLVLRFEGDDEQAFERVQQRFRELLLGVAPDLELPF